MDAQQFLAEFRHIANAPGGVAKLRALVLQLAISGRLTERVAGDVTADSLIELNRQRQKTLVAKKEIKRQPDPTGVSRGDQPWALPDGWSWTRLGYVTNYGDAPKFELEDVDEGTWVLELEDVEKGTSKLLTKVLARDRQFKSTKNGFPTGAVLYGKLRPYLDKVLIAHSPGVCTTEISPISFFEHIEAGYLRWFLKSPYFVAYADGSTYGMNLPRLGTDAAREALFPFPPRQEQICIVAKVDELMGLCDQLEQQQQDRHKLQNALRLSTVQALISAQSPHELQTSWQRLQASFGYLFQQVEDVKDLRALILDLAFVARLSSAQAGDEPVERLLKRTREAKAKKLATGEMKRKASAATDVVQLEVELPEHWARIPLDELFQFIDYRGKTPTKTDSGVVLVTAKNVRPGRLEHDPIEYISEESYAHWMTRGFPKVGDILFTTEAPLGNVALIEAPPTFALAQRVIDLQPFADLNSRCAMYFMMSPIFQMVLDKNSSGMTAKGIKAAKLKQLELPVPPIAEQARIVARVDQLMQICDDMEAQLRDADRTASRLAIASVAGLTGIANKQDKDTAMKAPQTELIAPLRLATPPDVKAQAPLATLLARHQGVMAARDLWQRFGREIDVFYAQLKTEVAHGWIAEPDVAQVREKAATEAAKA